MKTVLVAILLGVFVLGSVWLREEQALPVKPSGVSHIVAQPSVTPGAVVGHSAAPETVRTERVSVPSVPSGAVASTVPTEELGSDSTDPAARAATPKRAAAPETVSYAKQRARFLAAAAEHPSRAHQLFAAMESTVLRKRDAEVAIHVAWLKFRRKEYRGAVAWFSLADVWAPHPQATYGQALSRLRLGDTAGAIAVAQRDAARSRDVRKVLVQAVMAEAQAAHVQGDYSASLSRLEYIESYGPLPRDGRRLQAWNLAGLERDRESAELFAELYRHQPDMDSALGLFLSHSRLGTWLQLDNLAVEIGGPLDRHPPQDLAKAAQERGAALKARRLPSSSMGVATKH